jgi:class 3 adenylate cyclase
VLLDRSPEALLGEIKKMIKVIEPLASFLPLPILNLVVQSASHRVIPPDFPIASVMFVNLVGLAEAVDECIPGEEERAVLIYSRLIALINAAVEEHGGILKKLTYHVIGSNLLICFSVPDTFADNPVHAAEAALAIRKIIQLLEPPELGGRRSALSVQIGLARGLIFAGEVGEPHGRREFNILGDPVNTAARLMDIAAPNQILVSEEIYQAIASKIDCLAMGNTFLKGKHALIPVFAVR